MPKRTPLSTLESIALEEKDPVRSLERLRELLSGDERPAASRLLARFERKVEAERKAVLRLETLWVHEAAALAKGHQDIAGVDEAGRGPLAGPVVAAAVILVPGQVPRGLDDSKKLTPERREALFPVIHGSARAVGVGQASAEEIDALNIYQAARLAMERAVEALGRTPGFLLTDAMPLPKFRSIPQKPLVHGDALSSSIAAASIVAKVTRDRLMAGLHERYPAYGFDAHKGYGTEVHLAALAREGPCPEHRRTFAPVMEVLAGKQEGGALAFWSAQLKAAPDVKELGKVGLRIKRASAGLSQDQLGLLRDLFRERRERLG